MAFTTIFIPSLFILILLLNDFQVSFMSSLIEEPLLSAYITLQHNSHSYSFDIIISRYWTNLFTWVECRKDNVLFKLAGDIFLSMFTNVFGFSAFYSA